MTSSEKDIAMENDSVILETIKHDFCVEIEKCLNQFKKNGYYKNAFEDPGLLTTLSQKLFDYIQNQLTQINNENILKFKPVDIERILANTKNNETFNLLPLNEVMPDEQVCNSDDANENFHENHDDPLSPTAAVIEKDNNDDEMQNSVVESEKINEDKTIDRKIDRNSDSNKDDTSFDEIATMSDLDQQVEKVNGDNQLLTRRRSSRCAQRKINYVDGDGESSNNLEIKRNRGDVQQPDKKSVISSGSNSKECHISSKIDAKTKFFIPIETKKKLIKLVKENPNWSLKMIRQHSGCTHYLNKRILATWSGHVKGSKGTYYDKIQSINKVVYSKYMKFKKKTEIMKIDYKIFKKWALEAKEKLFPLDKFEFDASYKWLARFKKSHGIIDPRKKLTREEKENIVQLFDDNPTWSLKRLRKESGYSELVERRIIERFRAQITRKTN